MLTQVDRLNVLLSELDDILDELMDEKLSPDGRMNLRELAQKLSEMWVELKR